MENFRLFSFVGGTAGQWVVTGMEVISGEGLAAAPRVSIVNGAVSADGTAWVLRGVTSNERYLTSGEKAGLVARQVAVGRPEATRAAVIPIRKSAAWWGLSQEERREILEEKSRHIATGLKYLPAIARRLHHCRDLETTEAFDFITLFDYSAADEGAFHELLSALRATEEWKYVDREVDIRLVRDGE